MSWRYSGDPASSLPDEVRWLVGDTDISDQLVSDEEIAFALAEQNDSTADAARMILQQLVTRFAKLVDISMGQLSISYSQRAAAFAERLDLLSEVAGLSVPPWSAAMYHTDNNTAASDTNFNIVRIDRGMF